MSSSKHDALFSRSLEHPAIAKDFIYHHGPIHIKNEVAWDGLVLARVDRTNTDSSLTKRIRDIIYKAPLLRGGTIFIAVEHQSEEDSTMPLRYLRYIMDNIEAHSKEGNKKWPLLVSLQLYHGRKSPYPHGCETTEYYENPFLGNQELWFRFHIIDLTQISDEEILTYGFCAPLEILLKHSRDGEFELAVENYIPIFHACIQEVGDDYIHSMLAYADSLEDLKIGKKMHKFVEEVFQDKQEIIMTYGQFITTEARQEGLQEGLIKGIKEGLQEGLQEGLIKGIKEGMQEGMQKERMEIANHMLKKGSEVNFIEEITGLSREAIEKLKQK